jgi:hypothetical protein
MIQGNRSTTKVYHNLGRHIAMICFHCGSLKIPAGSFWRRIKNDLTQSSYQSKINMCGLFLIHRKVTIIVIVMLFILGCNKPEANYEIRSIDLTQNLNNNKELTLSDIATDINYIKLESNKDCYISDIKSYFIGNHYIVIQDKLLDGLYIFDINGKFLRKIGIKGKGPAECVGITAFNIDENEEFVYISTFDYFLKKYSLKGEFVRSSRLYLPQNFIKYIDNEEFVLAFPYPQSVQLENFSFRVVSFEGKILKRLLYRDISGANPRQTMMHPYIYDYLDTVCFWEKYCDTIYSVTKDKKLVPRWVLNDPKKAYSLAKQTNVEISPSFREGDLYISGFLETPNLFFLKAWYKNKEHHMVYEKGNKLLTRLPISAFGPGYINDIDGGGYFFPSTYTNNKLYEFFELDRFIQLRNEGKLPKVNVKNLKRKEILDKLIQEHNLNDNPVLMIVSLK